MQGWTHGKIYTRQAGEHLWIYTRQCHFTLACKDFIQIYFPNFTFARLASDFKLANDIYSRHGDMAMLMCTPASMVLPKKYTYLHVYVLTFMLSILMKSNGSGNRGICYGHGKVSKYFSAYGTCNTLYVPLIGKTDVYFNYMSPRPTSSFFKSDYYEWIRRN